MMSANNSKSGQSLFLAVKNVVLEIGMVLSGIGAAAAAANAVENHRQPDAADLRRLGLEGVTFRLNT